MNDFIEYIKSLPTHIAAGIFALIAASFTLFGVLLTALINPFFQSLLKNKDYRNDYYKSIITSRITAYKIIEDLLATLSPEVEHLKNTEPCLIIFWTTIQYSVYNRNLDFDKQYNLRKDFKGKRGKKHDEAYSLNLFSAQLATAMRQEAWLSKKLNKALQELFTLIIKIHMERDDEYKLHSGEKDFKNKKILLEIGKKYHMDVIRLRKRIKKHYYLDMLSLYEVEEFVMRKRKI